MSNIENLSTFYKITGSIEQRIQSSTGLNSSEELIKRINAKPTQDTVDLLMQSVCNQSCEHCHFVEDGYKGVLKIDSELLEEAQTIVDYFKKPGENAPLISTYPRELSLVLPVLKIRSEIGQDAIYTNASALDEKKIGILLQSGVKNAFVSLHGDKEHHMALTGVTSETYNKTLVGIELLVKAGMNVNAIMSVYKDNLDVIPGAVHQLQELGVDKLKLIKFFPAGSGKNLSADKILSKEDVLNVLFTVDSLRKEFPNFNIALYGMSFGPNFYSPNYFKYLAGHKEELSGDGNVFGKVAPESRFVCSLIGRQYIGISLGTKNLYPCFEALSFPELRMGKLTNDNGIDLELNESPFTPEKLRGNLQGLCAKENCEYQDFCLGGCRMHAYAIAKLKGEENPIYAGQDTCVTRILDEQIK